MLHKRRRYVEEVQVVGFGHNSEVLVKQLIEGSLNLRIRLDRIYFAKTEN